MESNTSISQLRAMDGNIELISKQNPEQFDDIRSSGDSSYAEGVKYARSMETRERHRKEYEEDVNRMKDHNLPTMERVKGAAHALKDKLGGAKSAASQEFHKQRAIR
eukprot:TRINITY_DN3317_c0_g1_i1.p1 TRINITY_DN3317_c0_g1~~TRINITY_DN3317_c0_g1_i1.p1  ORF type:complete len:107 (-),score=37.23 TRINITY_DN3317_c0_g1_i1:75-395(-)